jgi:hypothetical protein
MPESKFTPAQELDAAAMISTLAASEIVLSKGGPFALDIVHAPHGIESFEAANGAA